MEDVTTYAIHKDSDMYACVQAPVGNSCATIEPVLVSVVVVHQQCRSDMLVAIISLGTMTLRLTRLNKQGWDGFHGANV